LAGSGKPSIHWLRLRPKRPLQWLRNQLCMRRDRSLCLIRGLRSSESIRHRRLRSRGLRRGRRRKLRLGSPGLRGHRRGQQHR
ncbi:unnamed protein product, partial [Symbiodinium sp. CCMP2592]